MRIIAGSLSGRVFNDPPKFQYNPMSEKMRGALFNALGDIDGLTILDPFGGTGALSFEGISRGAAKALTVENDKRAQDNILKNIKLLNLNDKVKAIRANASGWSDNNPQAKFNLLLMDPPYDNLQLNLVQKLIQRHLKPQGVAVLSSPERIPALVFETVKMVTNKHYGDGQLIFYKKL